MAAKTEKTPEELDEIRLRNNKRRRELNAQRRAAKGPGPGATTTGKVDNVPAVQTNWRVKLQQSRIKFDDVQKQVYLKELAKHSMKGTAAKAAGVSLDTVRQHQKNDPDFAEQYAEALDTFRDKLVDHHHKLLFEGEITYKYDKDGNTIEEKHTFPIPLIMAELRRVDPDYRDKPLIDPDMIGGGVLLVPARTTPEEWIAHQAEQNANKERPMIEINPKKT